MAISFSHFDKLGRAEEKLGNQAKSLLWSADKEFVPAISERKLDLLRVQDFIETDSDEANLEAYYAELVKSQAIVAYDVETKEVAGFLCYADASEETAHVVVVIVKSEYRRKGIGRCLFERLFEVEPKTLTTRIWSTNEAMNNLLASLDFVLVESSSDENREGINILYLERLSR